MPTINVNDAYVLNETGAEVDKVTGLFTKNENATTGEKQMARLNIAAGGSNRNLLDNAYFVGGGSQLGEGKFPINQRGLTSYSANAYGIDRWICYGGAITLAADGISVPANGVFTQPTNNLTQLNGETLTLSVRYDSGIETGTAVLDLSGTTMFINNGAAGQTYITNGGLVQTYKGTASKIRAMKLELGTVSTLPNDPPPDFGEELAKCKRRLRYVPLNRTPVILDGGYSVAVVTLTGIEMASFPTASLITAGTAYAYNPLTSATPTSASVIVFDYNTPTIQLGLNAALNGLGVVYDTVIQLSCEL